MSDRYVVKRRHIINGTEVTTVLCSPRTHSEALEHLYDLNAEYQDPGNYYIEKWEDK